MINFGLTAVTVEDLLKKIVQQVRSFSGLGDRAFLSMWDERFMLASPRAQQFCTITPSNFPVWQSLVDSTFTIPNLSINPGDGTGSVLGYNSTIILRVYAQNNADPEGWSYDVLTEQAIGITQLITRCFGSLSGFVPIDGNGNAMVREYMRIADSGWRYTPVQAKDGTWWAKADGEIECKFTAKIPSQS